MPKMPTIPGDSVRTRKDEIFCDEEHRLVSLRRLDRLSRAELEDIVGRLRSTLWFRMRDDNGDDETADEAAAHPEVPDVDNGGVGGADAVDLILELLDGYGLNPKVLQTA